MKVRKTIAGLALAMSVAMFGSICASAANNYVFATGGTTGTYYAYGGVIAQVLNAKLDDIQLSVQSTGASKANIYLIVDGEAEFATVQNDVMDYAMNGTELFEGEGESDGFSTVCALYAEVCQIISTADITDIADLKGKRVSVGDAGSGVEFNAKQILAAYGIDIEKDIEKNNLSFGDSSDALKDGKIDAFFCTAGAPTTAITELATTNKINILSVDDEHAGILAKDYPFYTTYSIPGGTYPGIDADAQTVAVKATLICSSSLDDEVVYNVVKTIFENKDEITEAHAKGAELDPAYAVSGITVPFHPGAQKYFDEIGVTITETEAE
jgi:hypothetical protein